MRISTMYRLEDVQYQTFLQSVTTYTNVPISPLLYSINKIEKQISLKRHDGQSSLVRTDCNIIQSSCVYIPVSKDIRFKYTVYAVYIYILYKMNVMVAAQKGK